jgi:hypothetical protein
MSDGASLSSTDGIDTSGHYLAASFLSGLTMSGTTATFNIAPADQKNVVYAIGQTVPLPPGNYANLYFLATTAWNSYPNQPFTLNYSTGAPVTVQQSFSIWTQPQSYPGEQTVKAMPYRYNANGAQASTPVYLYGYTLPVDSTRQLTSIGLPNQGKINILAITLM